MTERLYYTSDAAECLAQVVNCLSEADGRYAIELDRTLFHPQGGGQPADRGWIAGLAVEGVVSRGDSVAHIVSQPLPAGEVTIRIDPESRRLHARLHSAGHVLAQAGELSLAGRKPYYFCPRRAWWAARGQRAAGKSRGLAGRQFTASAYFCRWPAQGRVRRHAELSLRWDARGQLVRTG